MPFMYYYHGAPDDYFRFTHSAMNEMLSDFRIARGISFGNRSLVVAQFFHKKRYWDLADPGLGEPYLDLRWRQRWFSVCAGTSKTPCSLSLSSICVKKGTTT